MSNNASLLHRLRIDRPETAPPNRSSRWWIGGSIIAIAGIALGSGLYARHREIVARMAVATPSKPVIALRPTGSVLDASGYVVARRRATVASKVTGKVVEVLLEEGQSVEKGAVMARLDDSNARAALNQSDAQVDQAEAVVAAAETAYEDAVPVFRRNERLRAAAMISAQSFDQAQAQLNAVKSQLSIARRALESARSSRAIALKNLQDLVIRAPFSGIVIEKAAQPGEMVSPVSAGSGYTRTGIGTIVDMQSLEVEVDVNENHIGRVAPHQRVRITLSAYPDWEIPGEVIGIIPTADRAKATVKVRIAILLQDARIFPDMGVRVSFANLRPP